MPQKRIWSMERAMIDGKPVRHRTINGCQLSHIRLQGQGKNRIVASFVTGPIAKFLVDAANEKEQKKMYKFL